MFDLERAIVEWRQRMVAGGIGAPAPLEELESHLRDAIEQRRRGGLQEEGAFRAAVEEMGQPQGVLAEFAKVGEAKTAIGWKWEQILMVAPPTVMSFLLASMILGKGGIFSTMTRGEQVNCLAATAVLPLLVWSGRWFYRLLPVVRAKRTRGAIAVSAGVLVGIWYFVFCCLIAPYREYSLGQLGVNMLWALFPPAGALVGLVWGIETAARKRVAMTGL